MVACILMHTCFCFEKHHNHVYLLLRNIGMYINPLTAIIVLKSICDYLEIEICV